MKRIAILLFFVSFSAGCQTLCVDGFTPEKEIKLHITDKKGNPIDGAILKIIESNVEERSFQSIVAKSDSTGWLTFVRPMARWGENRTMIFGYHLFTTDEYSLKETYKIEATGFKEKIINDKLLPLNPREKEGIIILHRNH